MQAPACFLTAAIARAGEELSEIWPKWPRALRQRLPRVIYLQALTNLTAIFRRSDGLIFKLSSHVSDRDFEGNVDLSGKEFGGKKSLMKLVDSLKMKRRLSTNSLRDVLHAGCRRRDEASGDTDSEGKSNAYPPEMMQLHIKCRSE
jgi:hypothetical protein